MATTTEQLLKALDEHGDPFPPEFIEALRSLLNTGLSCSQITSFLIVLQGMSELQDRYDEGELIGKAVEVLRIMRYLRTLNKVQDEDWFSDENDDDDSLCDSPFDSPPLLGG